MFGQGTGTCWFCTVGCSTEAVMMISCICSFVLVYLVVSLESLAQTCTGVHHPHVVQLWFNCPHFTLSMHLELKWSILATNSALNSIVASTSQTSRAWIFIRALGKTNARGSQVF